MKKPDEEKLLLLIGQSPLLSKLPQEVIREHLRSGAFRIERYAKDSVVFLEGERCDSLKIILSGGLDVDNIDEEGELLTISAFDFGCGIGGDLIFLDEANFQMTVSTNEDSILLSIGRETLFELLSVYPDFLRQYLRFTGTHAFRLNDKIKTFSRHSLRENLLLYLERERNLQQSDRIVLPTTKKALAEQLGVQRTSLSRELAKMRDNGLVEYDARTITLL
ncbi:MAG: Crp/Fnr family transcriptional regulator [Eubacteriales bacterium]|nr:Crp/Fnr family transcriptional regulator [Eubacteriales bacterium]